MRLAGGAGMGALLLILASCARGTTTYRVAGNQAEQAEAEVTEVITRALEAEAQGQNADSLYTAAPIIVVNGRPRATTPLFANVGTGGDVAITSSQLEIRAGLAWGLVEYRWNSHEGVTREGRATFVLRPGGDGRWKIQHVHSSSPR